MSLGANLKRLRVERDLSQYQLAIQCGISEKNVSHFETGYRNPGLNNIRKLKKGLNCTFDALLVVDSNN